MKSDGHNGHTGPAKTRGLRVIVGVMSSVLLTTGTATLALSAPAGATVRGAVPATRPAARANPHLQPARTPSAHTARALAPELAATPNLVPMTSVVNTFVVDTTSDTNPLDPTTACLSGNANTCSLRAAIGAANADTGNVDAVSIATGTVLTLSLGSITISNSMFINGTGATVSGGNSSQIFYEDTDSAAVEITGLTLTGGSSSYGGALELDAGSLVLNTVGLYGNTSSDEGGGLAQDGGQLWVDNSTFSANTAASDGGAMYLEGGAEQIENTTIVANVAPSGAGIYNDSGDLVVSDCNIEWNSSGSSTYGEGVGIYNDEVLTMTGSTIHNNTATDGGEGAGINNEYVADVSNTSFDNNSITGSGEAEGVGIYGDGDTFFLTNVTVDGSSSPLVGDNSVYGGAVLSYDTQFTWQGGSIDSTNNGNAPASSDYIEGGALYLDGTSADVNGVSISNTTNNAGTDEGVEGGAVSDDSSDGAALENLSITGTSNTGTYVYGGAIYNGDDEGASLSNIQISDLNDHASNTSGGYVYGGLIYSDGNDSTYSGLSANNTTVTADLGSAATPSSTESYIEGGLIYSEYESTIDNSSFTNTTVTASGGNGYIYGGGVYNDALLTVNNSQIIGITVTADYYIEGGIWDNYSQSVMQNDTLGNATVSVPGGPDATADEADGSILYTDSSLNMVNGTIANVTANVGAAGSYNWGIGVDTDGGVQFTNTTIANDTVSGPTGSTNLIWAYSGESFSLLNSIVASSTPSLNCGTASGGTVVSQGNNIDNGTSCGFTHPGDLQNTDPMVANLANNGGPVQTAALLKGSPAIDAANDAGCPPTDARGVSRPQGSACDIGSYEFVFPKVVVGYWTVATDGGIFAFGKAQFFGSMGGKPLNKPVVGMAPTGDGAGYWMDASDGGIFAFGDAQFHGSMGGLTLNQPVVGMAPTPDGGGYWLVAADGGIFAFGDAAFFGSMGGKPLNSPIVGMAATPDGGGYWLVAADGGLFSFGDANFFGSMGGKPLNKPVVGMATTGDGAGYWMDASDGGIFAFGDAAFFGSMGGKPLNKPMVGMASAPDGGGYWTVASDGGIFAFGDANFFGSMGGKPLNAPMVGMANFAQ
jgi:hypothetical protein